MKNTYDKKTAEFRTIRNLRGYNDNERNFPPSMVDDSDYEDINILVNRMLKGERVDLRSRSGCYDGAGSPEELMEAQSPLEQDGADLADLGPIVDGLKERQKARKASKKATPPAVPTSPQGEPEKAPAPPSTEVKTGK